MNMHSTKDYLPVRNILLALRRLEPYHTRRALWLAAAAAAILSAVMILGAFNTTGRQLDPSFHIIYVVAANILLSVLLYTYNFFLIRHGLQSWHLACAGLGGSLVMATLFSLGQYYLELSLYSVTSNALNITLFINLSAALIAYLISLLLVNVTRYQQAVVENEHLHSENLRIRYETLEQQLSPHFLFNSLNTLDGLIGIDDDRAHQYVNHLAATYRYTLRQQQLVTLADELEFSHNYISMMQIRYGDALNVDEHITEQSLAMQMPPISLQLLLENAIKHNVVSHRYPLTIHIASNATSITVSNAKHLKQDAGESHGIGLANLAERYRLLTGRDITITDDDQSFTVELPLI